jgi:hypothetical protein
LSRRQHLSSQNALWAGTAMEMPGWLAALQSDALSQSISAMTTGRPGAVHGAKVYAPVPSGAGPRPAATLRVSPPDGTHDEPTARHSQRLLEVRLQDVDRVVLRRRRHAFEARREVADEFDERSQIVVPELAGQYRAVKKIVVPFRRRQTEDRVV